MRRSRILLVATILACTGCARLMSLGQSGDSEGHRPVTEEECLQFADDLRKAVAANDLKRTSDLIGLAEPFKIAVADFEGSPEYHAKLRKSCDDAAAAHSFVPLLLAEVRKGGEFKLLRVHPVDGRPRALFRVIRDDGAVGYLDFIPAKFGDGKVRVEDVYVPIGAELVSESMRRIVVALAAETNEGPPGHPNKSTDQTWTKNMPKLEAMHQAIITEKYSDAVAAYRSMPEVMQNNRSIFLQYVTAAQNMNDGEYLIALDRFRRQFPGDPALIYQAVDYLRLMRQYEGAVRAIAAVEQLIGGDPCLRGMRAMAMAKAWRHKDARLVAEKAVEEEPTLKWAYLSRIRVSLAETNHPDTLIWLKKLVENTGFTVGDLRKDLDYVVFVDSPQYMEWLRWMAARKKG
jgi:hypothetical protein